MCAAESAESCGRTTIHDFVREGERISSAPRAAGVQARLKQRERAGFMRALSRNPVNRRAEWASSRRGNGAIGSVTDRTADDVGSISSFRKRSAPSLLCSVAGPVTSWASAVASPRRVIRDWSRVVRTGQYAAATGSFDYEAALAGYRGDILAVDVSDDVLAPRTATDALLAKVPRAHVSRYAYDSPRGSAKPGSHSTWVRDRGGLAPASWTGGALAASD